MKSKNTICKHGVYESACAFCNPNQKVPLESRKSYQPAVRKRGCKSGATTGPLSPGALPAGVFFITYPLKVKCSYCGISLPTKTLTPEQKCSMDASLGRRQHVSHGICERCMVDVERRIDGKINQAQLDTIMFHRKNCVLHLGEKRYLRQFAIFKEGARI